MRRIQQFILISATLIGSALGMQTIHETGHVLGAWLTGARVERVVLTPTTISCTYVVNNIHPLVVAWAGPFVGLALPVSIWLIASSLKMPGTFVLRFFVGFCLEANGMYIGLGSLSRVGDCGEMLRHGSAQWQL